MKVHMQEATDIFRTEYPVIEQFMKKQQDIFWTAHEIHVEKDVHDILTNFTEAEKHGVLTTLKLFTLYEVKAGNDYWTGRFMDIFSRHEFQSMAAMFGAMELSVHKPFYNKINELLNATNDNFYTDYVNNTTLRERMECIDSIINNDDPLLSIAGFSMVEGVILYSSFAFLKHFQSLGKNKLLNVVRGINSSAIDEELHALAGAYCFKELARQIGGIDIYHFTYKIHELAKNIYEHESAIIDMIFKKGGIDGITSFQMKEFVKERINTCLENLGLDKYYVIDDSINTISSWFYKGMKSMNMNDFFSGMGREYVRNWDETRFVWE